LHDALFRITDPSREAGKIGQLLKAGYKLNDRVIRAAEVGTICHPEN
jgi:molecular chaperone GrpE